MTFHSFISLSHIHEHAVGEGFAHSLLRALIHTAEHSWYMLIILFLVYLLIECIGHRVMGKLKGALSNPDLGIISGSALGLIPECGFSVAVSNLYAERLVSAGCVAAVFVATSDEALPLLAANPGSAKWLFLLIAIKFVYAVICGYAVNFVFKLTCLDKVSNCSEHRHHGSEHIHEGGEHHHCAHCDSGKGILHTAIIRSLSVFAFVLITSFAVNLAVELFGEDMLRGLLMTDSVFQPFLTALIGLLPNCAVSILTANLFAVGTLGFGSLVSALCSGAGIGMLVLFRVNRNMKQNFTLLGMLYILSALIGFVIEIIL